MRSIALPERPQACTGILGKPSLWPLAASTFIATFPQSLLKP
jgi:hypothetical protein